MLSQLLRPVSLILVVSFMLLDFSVSVGQAQIIDTHRVLAAQQQDATRQRVVDFFAREDVQQALMQQGVDIGEADKRVASLSAAELEELARTLDRLPAGGDAVGSIVGAAVFIFVLLLITDLLGLTHVYPFVSNRR